MVEEANPVLGENVFGIRVGVAALAKEGGARVWSFSKESKSAGRCSVPKPPSR